MNIIYISNKYKNNNINMNIIMRISISNMNMIY